MIRMIPAVVFATLAVFVASADAHIRVITPNGGEQLDVGSTVTVEWTIIIQHNQLNWDMWYSTTGPDGPWIEVAVDLPAGNFSQGSVHSYEWTIPDTVSNDVYVRVRMDNSGTDYYDKNDSSFSIVAPCRPDLNGDDVVNTQDFILFLNLWVAGDETADWNNDSMIDTRDFLAYLNDWVAGC